MISPPHPREFILVFGDFYFCSQIILPVLFCVFFKGEIARPEYISLLQENCTCSFCTILPGNLPDPRACPLRTKDNLGYQYAVGVGFEQTCPWWEQRSCYNKTRPVLEVYMIYVCWFLYIIWLSFSFLPLRIWSSVVFLREQLYCLVCTIMRKEIMVQLQTYTTQLIYVRCATRKWAKCLIRKLIFNKRLHWTKQHLKWFNAEGA